MPDSLHRPGERRLAAVLRERRREKDLTLSQLGALLGLANGNFVGMVERGERVPSDGKLLEWARILDLDGRDLVELKYREQPGSAVIQLFGPAPAELPYVREFLLRSCLNRTEMEDSLGAEPRSLIEDLIFQHLAERTLVEPILREKHGMPRLRHRVQEWVKSRRMDPGSFIEPEWFDEEGPAFVEFAVQRLGGWQFDRTSLTLTVDRSRHPGDHFVIPLVEPRLRDEVLRAAGIDPPRVAPEPGTGGPQLQVLPTLRDLLRREGLVETDVEEILDLVAFKKARRSRG